MSIERDCIDQPGRMPENVYDQLNHLPDVSIRGRICESVATGVYTLLTFHGIKIDDVSCRTKSVERINEKIKIRKSTGVIRDIYGVRFITEEPDRSKIKDLILSAYPLTPVVFSDGRPSVREYADPAVRDFIREKYNPHISSEHSAMHVNVVFKREGSNVLDIAEIQVMNAQELTTYNLTRESYVNGRNGSNGNT